MFYSLEGIVIQLMPDLAVISCGGVGYEISITPNTAAGLKLNENAKLFISESIGEDHFDLYGFLTEKEKRYYKLFISVSGIGPKAAMSILSCNTPDALTMAIINGDEKMFTNCPGIGKKTAQRIILELKDKISKESASADLSSFTSVNVSADRTAVDQAIAALTVLGYNTGDVLKVLKQIDITGMSSEYIIKAVLKYMI